MYLEFYGLDRPPFSITPDPHFVFLSEHHRDALAHLLYGIRQGGGGGFVQLTGEVGTGKTTLSRLLLSQLPEDTQAALVLNPRLSPVELLQTICEELRLPIGAAAAPAPAAAADEAAVKSGGKRRRAPSKRAPAPPPSGKQLFDALGAYLLDAYAKGQRVVLIVDEAQNLSIEALEQVRLLTNLETETQKLLQIILIGQPELREMLARPELRQLAQRITARYHLPPLDAAGTEAYLRHRLTSAGAARFPFSAEAVRRLHRRSGGVPRLINVIAERALLGGYAHDLLTIDARTVDRAADEALSPALKPSWRGAWRPSARDAWRPRWALAALGLALFAIVLFALWRQPAGGAAEAATTTDTARATTPTQRTSATSATAVAADATPQAPKKRETPLLDATAIAALAAAEPVPGARAWRDLRMLWKAPAALGDALPDCATPPLPGWRCLRGRAALDQLQRIQRPVLLRLVDARGEGWVLLLGADAGHARLSLQGQTFDLDRVALAGVWRGDYLALWPAPDGLETAYAAADAGARDWVRQRLARAGDPQRGTPDLREFQARHGLRSDGKVGAETLFALASRDPGPRLHAALE